VLTDRQKEELREMAASESLREEFRALSRNSRRIESQLTIDQFMRWLTEMSQMFPQARKPQRFVEYVKVRF
jgi:hypothetical protein